MQAPYSGRWEAGLPEGWGCWGEILPSLILRDAASTWARPPQLTHTEWILSPAWARRDMGEPGTPEDSLSLAEEPGRVTMEDTMRFKFRLCCAPWASSWTSLSLSFLT